MLRAQQWDDIPAFMWQRSDWSWQTYAVAPTQTQGFPGKHNTMLNEAPCADTDPATAEIAGKPRMKRMTDPGLQVHLLPVASGRDGESADLRPLLELLDTEEQARAARFRFARDRQLYVQAHVLLRRVLSQHAEIAPQDWRFERGRDGKPALCRRHHPALRHLRFNLAHCQGMAAVIVAQGREVGIDVEHLDAIDDPAELAATILAPSEQTEWRRIGDDPIFRRQFLLTRWTLKEAALKATGSGLGRHAPDTLTFALDAHQRWTLHGPARLSATGRLWRFVTTTLGPKPHPSLHLALAIEPRENYPADGLPVDYFHHADPT